MSKQHDSNFMINEIGILLEKSSESISIIIMSILINHKSFIDYSMLVLRRYKFISKVNLIQRTVKCFECINYELQ